MNRSRLLQQSAVYPRDLGLQGDREGGSLSRLGGQAGQGLIPYLELGRRAQTGCPCQGSPLPIEGQIALGRWDKDVGGVWADHTCPDLVCQVRICTREVCQMMGFGERLPILRGDGKGPNRGWEKSRNAQFLKLLLKRERSCKSGELLYFLVYVKLLQQVCGKWNVKNTFKFCQKIFGNPCIVFIICISHDFFEEISHMHGFHNFCSKISLSFNFISTNVILLL